MQATKRQVLTALFVGVLFFIAGAACAASLVVADNMDERVGFGLVALVGLLIGGMLVRAAVSEIKDAIQD